MDTPILPVGGVREVAPGPATLEADLVHDTVIAVPGGGFFAGGWGGDTQTHGGAAETRRKDGA